MTTYLFLIPRLELPVGFWWFCLDRIQDTQLQIVLHGIQVWGWALVFLWFSVFSYIILFFPSDGFDTEVGAKGSRALARYWLGFPLQH